MTHEMPEQVPLQDPRETEDRFLELVSSYQLITEVFQEQCLDYQELQKSAVAAVRNVLPNMTDLPILEVGVGDGETTQLFVDAGCTRLTGLDLNHEMLLASKKRFGDQVPLVQGNATQIDHLFGEGTFEAIVSASCIHNIPKENRGDFFQALLNLHPKVVVLAEKIVDADEEKHRASYVSEVAAIKKVFGEKHHLDSVCEEWVRHYEYDERERLEYSEIADALGENYDLSIVFEMGMFKTVLAMRKEK